MSFLENHRGCVGFLFLVVLPFFISLSSGVDPVKLGALIQFSLRSDSESALSEAEQAVAFFQHHVPFLSVAW